MKRTALMLSLRCCAHSEPNKTRHRLEMLTCGLPPRVSARSHPKNNQNADRQLKDESACDSSADK